MNIILFVSKLQFCFVLLFFLLLFVLNYFKLYLMRFLHIKFAIYTWSYKWSYKWSRNDYIKPYNHVEVARLSENHSCIAFSRQLPSYDSSDTDHLSLDATELTQVRCIIHDIGRKLQVECTYCPASIHREKSFGKKFQCLEWNFLYHRFRDFVNVVLKRQHRRFHITKCEE